MNMEFKELSFFIDNKDVKEEDRKRGIFEGYASIFDNDPDDYGDVVAKGAFKKTLAKGGRNGNGIAMLWQHDFHNPIGVWEELKEDGVGLKVRGKLSLGVRQADEALILMQDKALQGLSIGFRAVEYEINKEKEIRLLKEVELYEISPVTFPAKITANILSAKSIENASTERELEKLLCDAGLSHKLARSIIKKCKPGLRKNKQSETGGSLGEIQKTLKTINAEIYVQTKLI